MIPDIAIGAIGAALIGAMISLVGLIVAKEAKVSEFRQSWIDALRTELSAFMTNVNAVADARSLGFKDDTERFEKLQPFYSKLNEAYYLVALRLNSNEDHSFKLKACMVQISSMVVKPASFDQKTFDEARVAFINTSNQLLKAEWKRVKEGEKAYRYTRWAALGAVIALMALAGLAIVNKRPATVPVVVAKPAKVIPVEKKPAVATAQPIPTPSEARVDKSPASVPAPVNETARPSTSRH